MRTEVIKLQDAKDMIHSIVEEFGPETTRDCTYHTYKDDEVVPNCIIGEALHRWGVSMYDLENYIFGQFGMLNDEQKRLIPPMTKAAFFYLDEVQAVQDGRRLEYDQSWEDPNHVGWGVATERADQMTFAEDYDDQFSLGL